MIIHPDGRLEGTPEELATYQKQMRYIPDTPVYAPYAPYRPYWDTGFNPLQWPIKITCGEYSYNGPQLQVMN